MSRIGSRLAELGQDWVALARADGLRAAPRILAEIGGLIWSRHDFFLIRSTAPAVLEPPDVTIRPFAAVDVDVVAALHRPSEGQQCARRLRLGQPGLVAEHGGRFAGYAFCALVVDAAVDRFDLPVAADELYYADLWIVPELRRHRIGGALTLAAHRLARALDRSAFVGLVRTDNLPSIRTLNWVRCQVVGKASYRRVLAHRRTELERWPAPIPLGDVVT